MKKIEEIVEIILSQLMLTDNIEVAEKKIIFNLLKKGYELEEINEAFNLISEKIKTSKKREIKNRRFVRILTPIEKINLTKDAEDYLIYLYNSQIVDIIKLEEIILEISKMDRLIDKEELNTIIEVFIGMRDFQYKYNEGYN